MNRLQCVALGLATIALALSAGRADGRLPRDPERSATDAERRALAYLAREVPRWSVQNKCYSCHNNGDGARALYVGLRMGREIPPNALADTSAWLAKPERWDHNGGEGPFSDKRLARIQFASALETAIAAGQVKERRALPRAAQIVAADQAEDGSWPVEDGGMVGSPASYGQPLASYMAREVLRSADAAKYRDSINKASRWLRGLKAKNVTEAAIVVLATNREEDSDAIAVRRESLALLRRAQGDDGGWGPYANSPPEPFDTAIVLVALSQLGEQPDIPSMIERGRSFLEATQLPDGSWPETTRPASAESYAERLSTAAWATLALLATSKPARAR
jgi:squalene-hopene cyclase-like protein